MQDYTDLPNDKSCHFEAAFNQFNDIVKSLIAETSLEKPHGDIERSLSLEGTELLRRLLQAHFDWRSDQELPQAHIEGGDGQTRTHRRKQVKRELSSVFGKITYHRMSYSAPGAEGLCPMDGVLNLGTKKYTDGLKERICVEVSKASFDECVQSIAAYTGSQVGKRQCEQIIADTSQGFESFYAGTSINEESTSDLLVISTDSKGIVMINKDLRLATKQAAEKSAEAGSKARLSPGEKSNRKRMATTAAVYTVASSARSAEQVMSRAKDNMKPSRPEVKNKRVWASVERGKRTVISEAIEEALSRDPTQQRGWVVVVDGEINQLHCIHKELEACGAHATIVLDFIHVLEYLWKAAYCFHPAGSEQAERWVEDKALKILQGKSADVAAGMRRSATRQALSQGNRKEIDKCAGYLQNNRAYLKYDKYLKAGYPIASGVIEGACRHLINDRMDITGARWGLKTAEAVLKLRSLRSSGDFEQYWEYHKQRELERNHLVKYQGQKLPKVA